MSAGASEAFARSPKVQVVLTDTRVFVSSHCWHAPTCVAVTAAVQTFARICAFQELLSEPVEMTVGEQPTYDVKVKDSLQARQAIAGLLSALYGIHMTKADTIVMSDNRKQDDVRVPAAPGLTHELENASGGFAEQSGMLPVKKLIDGSSAEAKA